MTTAVRLADLVTRFLALVASIGVMAMMVHVCLDVALRAITGAPLPATVEIVSRYYMVLVAFLPLAWVERRNGMVSVEVFEAMMPPAVQRLSDIAVALLAVAIYAVMTATTWITALDNFQSGTFVIALNTAVPVWPGYFLPPLGFGLACLAVAVRAGQTIAGTPTPHADLAP